MKLQSPLHSPGDRVFLTVSGDELLPVRAWGPLSARRAVVALHGMMSHAGWFAPLAALLAAEGQAVFAVERRGSGEAKGLRGAADLDAWVDDIRRAVKLARQRADDVTLLCWCWGARTGAIAAAEEAVDRVVLAAPAFMLDAAVVARMQQGVAVDGEVPLPYHPVDDFSDHPRVRRMIEDDLLRWTAVPTAFLEPSRIALERALAALPRLTTPLRCLLASEDRLVDNAATRSLLTGHHVEEIPGGHAFVLERPEAIAQRLMDFAHV